MAAQVSMGLERLGKFLESHFVVSFHALVIIRIVGAVLVPALDCDEVFNYWEPLHYVLFGRGLQTWEYSPEFALRTWAYIGLHAIPAIPWTAATSILSSASLFDHFGDESLLSESTDKVLLFYFLKSTYAVACAGAEISFVRAVIHKFGAQIGGLTFILLAFNTGMFHEGTSFLPSTTCMICVMASYAAWMRGNTLAGLCWGSFAVLMCWPFSALCFVPMGFDALRTKGVAKVAATAIACVIAFIGIPALIDYYYYGVPVFATLNIVLYNALAIGGKDGAGANLYGTEPIDYYIRNMILNFNVGFVLALLSPFLVLAFWGYNNSKNVSRWDVLKLLSGPALTIAMFSSMAHKEERFLSLVYPILCFAAAVSILTVLNLGRKLSKYSTVISWSIAGATIGAIVLYCALSASRNAALHINFSAPHPVYSHLSQINDAQEINSKSNVNLTVCVGKEWYRFPSSFFLPMGVKLLWLNSSFDGLLPQPFSGSPHPTRIVHDHFNDRNEGVSSAYSRPSECSFAVDLNLGTEFEEIGDWEGKWTKVHCEPFLDSENSPALLRSFFIPFFSPRMNKYTEYCLLQRKQHFTFH